MARKLTSDERALAGGNSYCKEKDLTSSCLPHVLLLSGDEGKPGENWVPGQTALSAQQAGVKRQVQPDLLADSGITGLSFLSLVGGTHELRTRPKLPVLLAQF